MIRGERVIIATTSLYCHARRPTTTSGSGTPEARKASMMRRRFFLGSMAPTNR
jgi:hypothetical protein